VSAIDVLMKHGAEGATLSEIAQKAGHPEIALILERAVGRDEAQS